MNKKLLILSTVFGLAGATVFGSVIYNDDFNTSQGATWTTAGQIGTSGWNTTRSGDDWGARIDGNILELTNTASAAARAIGWVYVNRSTDFGGDYNQTLSDSNGLVTWSFNMQQIRTNPAGFGSNTYGVAFVIGSTSTTVASAGDGYAIVLGNSGTPDPIRFVSFTGGLQSLGTTTDALITAGSPLDDPRDNWSAIQLTYDPSDNNWSLFGRLDSADPTTVTLTSLGSIVNDTYTGTSLTSMGGYWQGSTAGTQTAGFDNISVTAIPEPSMAALMVIGIALIGRFLRKK